MKSNNERYDLIEVRLSCRCVEQLTIYRIALSEGL
jgi:hypothetical protein